MKKSLQILIIIILENNKANFKEISRLFNQKNGYRMTHKKLLPLFDEAILILKNFTENTILFTTNNRPKSIPRLFPEDTQKLPPICPKTLSSTAEIDIDENDFLISDTSNYYPEETFVDDSLIEKNQQVAQEPQGTNLFAEKKKPVREKPTSKPFTLKEERQGFIELKKT